MSEARADPDELLRRVTAEERRASRGKLVIFFGAAPGVAVMFVVAVVISNLTRRVRLQADEARYRERRTARGGTS